MMEMIITILKMLPWCILVAVLFSLAVFIHEFGHFLAARLLGFKVEVFSIGFGPALWQKKINGVVYKFSAIPLGGYVSLPQLDPAGMEKLQGKNGDETAEVEDAPKFMAPWKNIVVSVAGPLGNVFLALICATVISIGAPKDATGASAEIGYVEPGTAAADAGLKKHDVILAVNGNKVKSFDDFRIECQLNTDAGGEVMLDILRDGKTIKLPVMVNLSIGGEISIVDGVYASPTLTVIAQTLKNSPAAFAGLQKNDVILSVDGKKVETPDTLKALITDARPKMLEIKRGKETLMINVSPRAEGDKFLLGVSMGVATVSHSQWMTERGVFAQIANDVNQIFRVLKALTAPEAKGERGRAAKALGGPVMIAQALYYVVQTSFWSCLGFIRLICINLAVLNLLPIPVLDGGHIMFALYSIIFRRRPNPAVIATLVNAFAILLLIVMVYFIYNDVRRSVQQKNWTEKDMRVQPQSQQQSQDVAK